MRKLDYMSLVENLKQLNFHIDHIRGDRLYNRFALNFLEKILSKYFKFENFPRFLYRAFHLS